MAPVKFEENIKEKLDKRTIQPSTDAWSKLSTRLDAQEQKKNKNLFWWFGIAASIVGVVFITSQFVNNPIEPVKPTIVDIKSVEKAKTIEAVASEEIEDLNETQNVIEELQSNNSTTNKVQKATATNKQESKIVIPKEDYKLKEAVASNTTQNSEKILKEKPLNNLELEKIKIDEAVAKIRSLENSGVALTDKAIDDLLKEAEREIFKDKLKNENIRTVNANDLLQDVEADLEQSFRTKVFETLKNSYDSVKTAVANRNN